MKSFRKIQAAAIAAVVMSGASIEAAAGWEQVVGSVVGAGLGNQVGGGNGKVIATVVGGVAGNEVGKHIAENRMGQAPVYTGYAAPTKSGTSVRESVGTVAGAVVGAALGNQIGGGNGKILATVVGGIGGAMLGGYLAKPNEIVMRDVQGRQWKNGEIPMDPVTELPNFRRELNLTQMAYGEYLVTAERASAAKNDYDWKRINDAEYYKVQSELQMSASRFDQARSRMNDISSSATTRYNRKIDIDDLLVIASCNAVPVGTSNVVSYQQVMEDGRRCMPNSRLTMK